MTFDLPKKSNKKKVPNIPLHYVFWTCNSLGHLVMKVNIFYKYNSYCIVVQWLIVFFRIFSVLSAILYLGNVTYQPKDVGEELKVGPDCVLSAISDLLKVPLATLVVKINSSQETKLLPLILVQIFFYSLWYTTQKQNYFN